RIRVPAGALKAELATWAAAFEGENDRRPSRKETADQRELLRQQFRNRAVPATQVHDLSWNLKGRRLQIWASARKLVDEIQISVEEAFNVKLIPLVPVAMAARAGIADGALGPTPELVGGDVAAEVSHG
ncbi:MAG TPA: hypothetical protein VEY30_01775, partial [Myxococcaceae bacterium]|nr:hypothetical protein [Myxococcaceae bacterium]